MLKNYITIAFRNLIRSRGYSFINISGLAIGLACCIAIGLYVVDEYSYDRFHTNLRDIYRVVEQQNQAGTWYNVAVSPGPLAPALKADFPEIGQTCRIGFAWAAGSLKLDTITVEPDRVLVVDNSFFSMFDFRLTRGNTKSILADPNEVVITETLAARIFGPAWRTSNKVIGSIIKLRDGRVLTLTGIAQDPPTNSHIQFDVLLSFRREEVSGNDYQWNSNTYHTYLQLKRETDVAAFEKKIYRYISRYQQEVATTLSLQPLSDIYLHSHFDFQTDWSKRSNIMYVRIFLAVATIVLLIALFNFINLSTARAVNRAKEVGVRKVVGALRKQLIAQFLSEAFIMTSLAVVLSLALLQLSLPLLNTISGKSLMIPFQSPSFVLTVIGFTMVVTVLAGVYPAFYLSRFKPVRVLKGVLVAHSGKRFRQSLVVIQFAFSVILVIGTIVIYHQLTFLQKKDPGFDKSSLIYVEMKNELRGKASVIKTELAEQTSVAGVCTTSANLVDINTSTHDFQWEGQQDGEEILITHLNIDPDFIPTTGMTLLAGRNFDPAIASDTSSAYILNETAAREMGWTPQQALDKKITFWSEFEGVVIGVVKDFHFRPMTTAIEPCLFRTWPRQRNAGLFVRAKADHITETISIIERLCKKYDHTTIPHYAFVDDVLQAQYQLEQNTARIVMYFSILAILVSCLGLFGLATFTSEQRTKEIGIRKALGASVGSIVNLLSTEFLKLVVIAIAIASPVAWWGAEQWLNEFAYKTTIEWWMFVLAGIEVIGVALFTVSFQSIKAAVMSPVESLRSE